MSRVKYIGGFLAVISSLLLITGCPNSLDKQSEQTESFMKLSVDQVANDVGTTAVYETSSAVQLKKEPTLKVTPSGKDAETKFRLQVSGTLINKLRRYHTLNIMYKPPATGVVANKYFLGFAETTNNQFNWIDGISVTKKTALDDGWFRIDFSLLSTIKNALVDGKTYGIYVSFINEDAQAKKVPLTTPFFLGGMEGRYYAEEASPAEDPTASTQEETIFPFDNLEKLVAKSGSIGFSISKTDVLNKTHSTKVTPSGSDQETKIRFSTTPKIVDDAANKKYKTFRLTYKPGAAGNVPNGYFLGMIETTGGQSKWIDGTVASASKDLSNGWKEVYFTLTDKIKNAFATGKTFDLIISFFKEKDGTKTPLDSPFYVEELRGIYGAKTRESLRPFVNTQTISKDGGTNPTFSTSTSNTRTQATIIQVTPSGNDSETKLKFSATADLIIKFAARKYPEIRLTARLGTTGTIPNTFFLGLAETNQFRWIDGVTAKNTGTLSNGWVSIDFAMTDKMKNAFSAGKTYDFFLSFSHVNQSKSKVNLDTAFYIEELQGAYFVDSPPKSLFSFDNTGKTYADGGSKNPGLESSTSEVLTKTTSIIISPSGNSGETKVTIPTDSSMVSKFVSRQYKTLRLIFKPGTTGVIPNKYFLGIEETTGKTAVWVDGTLVNNAKMLSKGWKDVSFVMTDKMKKAFAAGKSFNLIVSFFNEDSTGTAPVKVPLNTPLAVEEIRGVW